ncbi:GNAT family N-acetyltransferase [Micromonospora saelicesensis]|uniref:Acetyltransferase (GNAT) family protein n=1 Tax=Micromonospora saelicesensis TaxID=285676 RepID=A0A1C4VVM5_9ACTN|nr:GNAT family N-acetyltransferase [Micromonospora saelicesensis]SCE88074.1 Acetyltransferase (GNAT) family protein [Micromonospora saelicesensis]
MTITARPTWTTNTSRPDHPDAVLLLREYMTEMVVRYHRRSALPGEVDAALAELPSDDLTTPSGLLLLAHHGTDLAGCAGLRWQPGWAELTRVFIRPEHRGAGGGAVLLAAVEERARAAGADRIRLDTRHDLVEARALYARHGYAEIPAYSRGPYAEHWFEKRLSGAVDAGARTR